jgi:hypothetical protein
MTNAGIADTNDPAVKVLWEQQGRVVHMALVVDRPPPLPALCLRLPNEQ